MKKLDNSEVKIYKPNNLEMEKFIKEDLKFFMPKSFKSMSQEYMLDAIFDDNIQNNWIPSVGDVIVGSTGNIFVISAMHSLISELGGNLFFFGGGLCSEGGPVLNKTYSSTMNESGKWYVYSENGIKEKQNLSHSAIKDFRFVPYPHEIDSYLKK